MSEFGRVTVTINVRPTILDHDCIFSQSNSNMTSAGDRTRNLKKSLFYMLTLWKTFSENKYLPGIPSRIATITLVTPLSFIRHVDNWSPTHRTNHLMFVALKDNMTTIERCIGSYITWKHTFLWSLSMKNVFRAFSFRAKWTDFLKLYHWDPEMKFHFGLP